jgi:hypothetical protein
LFCDLNSLSTPAADLERLIEEQAFMRRIASSTEEGRRIGTLPGDADTRQCYRSLGACGLQVEVLPFGEIERFRKRECL